MASIPLSTLLVLLLVGLSAAAQAADRVVELPGQPSVEFAQYAGYVTVNQTLGHALFYWFVEATTHPQQKPLVLWLNGGPGCSSLYGAFQEIGPFFIKRGMPELGRNPHAWNQDANLLFLESPASVGFSYTNTSQDLLQFGDELAAHELLQFLIGWFKRFPSYKGHEFYIAGEGYAGHTVPQLAEKILKMNKQGRRRMNLKGVMIGNPSLDNSADDLGMVQSAWDHAIMSDELYDSILKACRHFSDDTGESDVSQLHMKCDGLLDKFYQTMTGDIYLTSLYSPICTNISTTTGRVHVGGLRYMGYDPCSTNYTEVYFNRADVQKALHATTKDGPWAVCSLPVFNHWQDSPASVLPVIKKLIGAGVRIWVYSGDTDGRAPTAGTRLALRKLKLQTVQPWRKWFAAGDQVAGFTVAYKGLVQHRPWCRDGSTAVRTSGGPAVVQAFPGRPGAA